jgi:hypothetical protein
MITADRARELAKEKPDALWVNELILAFAEIEQAARFGKRRVTVVLVSRDAPLVVNFLEWCGFVVDKGERSARDLYTVSW